MNGGWGRRREDREGGEEVQSPRGESGEGGEEERAGEGVAIWSGLGSDK